MSLEQDIRDAKTISEGKRIAQKGIRKAIDDAFIPLILEKKVKLSTYGDICFALGYLGTENKQ